MKVLNIRESVEKIDIDNLGKEEGADSTTPKYSQVEDWRIRGNIAGPLPEVTVEFIRTWLERIHIRDVPDEVQ